MFFAFLDRKIENLTDQDAKNIFPNLTTSLTRTLLSGGSATMNGVVIYVLTEVYKYFSKICVEWENHQYQSDEQNSYIVKTFIFNFFISYTNLFYYAFYLQSFEKLMLNFILIIVSKNILFLVKSNLLPFLIYQYQKKKVFEIYRTERKKLKKNLLNNFLLNKILKKNLKEFNVNLNGKKIIFDSSSEYFYQQKKNIQKLFPLKELSTEDQEKLENIRLYLINEKGMRPKKEFSQMTQNQQNQILQVEKEIILQDQVELTVSMVKPYNIIELWMNNAIQFGYIAFFSIAFPLAPLYGCLINFLHINLLFHSLTTYTQRIPSKERGDIGIWKHILSFMIYVALAVNAGILAFTKYQDQEEKDSEQKYQTLLGMILTEHFVFFLIFVISEAFNDKPRWLKEKEKVQAYRRKIHEAKAKENDIKAGNSKMIKQATAEILQRKSQLEDDIDLQQNSPRNLEKLLIQKRSYEKNN